MQYFCALAHVWQGITFTLFHWSTGDGNIPRNAVMHKEKQKTKNIASKQTLMLVLKSKKHAVWGRKHFRKIHNVFLVNNTWKLQRAPLNQNWVDIRRAANLWDIVRDVRRDASTPQLLDYIDGFGHWWMPDWDHQSITGTHWWLMQRKKKEVECNKNK